MRLDFEPGEAAQVDWGEFGDVFGDGIKIHCFAMVLCFSRFMYLEFTRSEKFEDFIRCHENAFKFFGGVPRECWYDNLGSAVTDRAGQLICFNSRFMAYMGHHGIRPHACNVARGNEKGRVEDMIKYIRMNFWAGRIFADFEGLQKQALVWRNQFANQREHRSTRRVVRLFFEFDEKPSLLALIEGAFENPEYELTGECTLNTKGHGRVESRHLVIKEWCRELANQHAFPFIKQICKITRTWTNLDGTNAKTESRFCITSAGKEKADAADCLRCAVDHWAIENSSHYVRDETFDEDRSRIRKGNAPQVMATIRNLSIGVIRLSGGKNVAEAVRYFSWGGKNRALRALGV